MDGNNSLKRVAKIGDRAVADLREFADSDYFLPTEFVDRFKDEVKAQTHAADDSDSDSDWVDDEELEGTPADGADDPLDNCTKNWKSAASDEKKRMWGIFDETGIFAASCRHGLILWIVDMIRSGEL